MKLIKGNKFKINGKEYQITAVTFKNISNFERESYTFRSTNWDEPVMEYTMKADEFDSKVSFEQYVSLT